MREACPLRADPFLTLSCKSNLVWNGLRLLVKAWYQAGEAVRKPLSLECVRPTSSSQFAGINPLGMDAPRTWLVIAVEVAWKRRVLAGSRNGNCRNAGFICNLVAERSAGDRGRILDSGPGFPSP